ncbi:hypothetical protein PUNSTDRAFT_52850 [Punctularia strigosozonata HHB-11173 SS5]|uniref:uncharacterized protein n=1 Tax=Punctularia strigosozonata (strain HHB-11173) TaxID=741275 RepID=UPI0004417E7D|nr:uncharacterized protein PUNSTDRAFT_52850 [Punctularia strigosozonata HHB-11173 SS5]EIN08452.1 hypothetical protein PUNSTDRAFT_52850 [Punctularia strigosozonata HHB-11173 SS5]
MSHWDGAAGSGIGRGMEERRREGACGKRGTNPEAWAQINKQDAQKPARFRPMALASAGYPQLRPVKRQRRTATSVLAGDFDPLPQRDVLTSLLNGVGIYQEVEMTQETRRARKKEKRERDKEKRRGQREKEKQARAASGSSSVEPSAKARGKQPQHPHQPTAAPSTSAFWRARPAIHIATNQRTMSVTPPPMPHSPGSTPEPDDTDTITSRTSSKRPRTPDDDESIGRAASPPPPEPKPPKQKKKRVAARKGWKGWVEGSPPPSEKLINLDQVVVLNERRTRSGRMFDGVAPGPQNWVKSLI